MIFDTPQPCVGTHRHSRTLKNRAIRQNHFFPTFVDDPNNSAFSYEPNNFTT